MVTNQKIFFYSSSNSPIFKHSKIDFIITSKNYGFSTHDFSSLNLGYHTGDAYINVSKNRNKICKLFYPKKPLLWLNQIHSDLIITHIKPGTSLYQTGDSLICKSKKIKAMIMVADCVPVCIFDSKNNVFALIHAGRLGLFQKIISKTIIEMSKIFSTKSKDLLAYIGPCIHPCCYEVDAKILLQTKQLFKNDFENFVIEHNQKFFLNLPAMAKFQLTDFGISGSNIEISPTCTFEEENLFSYRRNNKTGRFALIASLK
ncbi:MULTISPECIES: peptidoglycan editing factor PgeF [unclassified Helicobacter]|uniref:peptidoglycan editing factor PgeF n=1 Tax=unclassified Helicobacter TaxID=2593540 RepID=UPI000CF10CD4|nr:MULTISPECIES: peptidoglycan editing factor PgeF [unclassified Helicobacter]